MQLAYDDETGSFQFLIENPCEIDTDIEIEIKLDGGLSQFKRAYSIAKFMESTSGHMIGSLYAATEHTDLAAVRKNLRAAIKEANEFLEESKIELESGQMPADLFLMVDESTTATCKAGRKFLKADLETVLDMLCLTDISLVGDKGLANFTLPHIGDPLVTIEFSLTIPVNEMIDDAMAEKDASITLH